jgi:hypothetical protein
VKEKIIVTTFVRTGSTWIVTILEQLLREKAEFFDLDHVVGFPLSEENVQKVIEMPNGLYKTHSFSTLDGAKLLRHGVKPVSIQRNFKDVLLSYLLYCRHVRLKQQLGNLTPIETFINETAAYDLTDEEFVNLFVESRGEFLETFISEWSRFQHVLCSQFTCMLNYDGLKGDTLQAAKRMIRKLDLAVKPFSEEKLLAHCSLESMRKQHDPGHVRSGLIGGAMTVNRREEAQILVRKDELKEIHGHIVYFPLKFLLDEILEPKLYPAELFQ